MEPFPIKFAIVLGVIVGFLIAIYLKLDRIESKIDE